MKRILTLIMAVIIAVGMMAGCGKKNDKETNIPSGSATENNADVIATIDEYYITTDMLYFYLDQAVSEIQTQSGSAPGWEKILVSDGLTARDASINLALDYAKQDYSIMLEAKALGVYSEEKNEEFIKSYIDYNGGEETFNQMMAMYGYDADSFKTYLKAMNSYQSILALECTEEEAAEQFNGLYGNGDYYVAKHILITFDGRSDENSALQEANAAYERAVNGENFEDLIVELNEDPGEDPEVGYLFTDGDMVIEFEDAVKGLKIGEISKPVRTDYGYHVIKRYDIPKKGDAAYDDYIHEMRITIGSSRMTEEKINAIFDKYVMDVDDSKYSSIDLTKYTTAE